MSAYYITLFLVILFCIIAQHYDCSMEKVDATGRYQHSRISTVFFMVGVFVLIFVAGMRYEVGTDFNNYYLRYEQYAMEFWEHLQTLEEPGFRFVCWVTVQLGGNGATVIFIASMVTIGLFLRAIYHNTDKLLMATTLFVFLGCWHGCFNGVRQYLAAAIVFSGIRYIRNREFKKYCAVVLLAFLFHASAILMIFAYFVVHNRINVRNISLMVLGSFAILFSFDTVMNFTSFLLDAEYAETDTYVTSSVNFLRVLVAIVPAVFFLIMYSSKKMNEDQKCWMNYLILNAIMMFATSNSTYLARMGIYTTPFLAVAIPGLIKGLNYRNRKLIQFAIPIAYALYWWYEISHSGTLSEFRFIWQAK